MGITLITSEECRLVICGKYYIFFKIRNVNAEQYRHSLFIFQTHTHIINETQSHTVN